MFLLGIDIAKLNHVASCVDSSTNEVIFSNFKFKNDFKGFSALLDEIKSLDVKNLIIGLESTSHYGENLINFLFKQHFKVALINPLQTSHLRKANIRDAKNDRLDSLNIAKSLIFGKLNFVSEKNIDCFSLKKLTRFRSNLIKQRSKAKIQLTSLLDLLFPELQYLFKSKIHSKAIYTLLKKYPSAEEIAALKDDEISNLLYASSKGHFKKEKSIELKSLAKTTVGIKDTSISLHLIQLIELIELYTKQIKDIEIKITGLRPGEKLYEERLMEEEGMQTTPNKLISIGKPLNISESFLNDLDDLIKSAYNNDDEIKDKVAKIVTTYKVDKERIGK